MPDDSINAAWSVPEQWAWDEVSAGRIADFSARFGELDPGASKGWGPRRTLGGHFLHTMLSQAVRGEFVPKAGICIIGARFPDPLSLRYAHFRTPLWLEKCRFEKHVDLKGLRVDGRLSLAGSAFRGDMDGLALNLAAASAREADLAGCRIANGLTATDIVVEGILDLSDTVIGGKLDLDGAKGYRFLLCSSTCRDVTLLNAQFAEDADLSSATLTAALKMDGIRIGQNLTMTSRDGASAIFETGGSLQSAFVGGSIDLGGATVKGVLNMNDLQVGKNLFLRTENDGISTFGSVDLTAARIDGQIECQGATFKDGLIMNSVRVQGSAFLSQPKKRSTFGGDVDLRFARIGARLDLIEGRFKAMKMEGIQIGEGLAGWSTKSRATIFRGPVDLTNARIKEDVNFGGARFHAPVNMSAMQVEGNIVISGATFTAPLTMTDILVEHHFVATELDGQLTKFKSLNLQNADVHGQIACLAVCEGDVSLQGAHVGHHLFLRAMPGAQIPKSRLVPIFKGQFDLSYAKIDGILDLNGATFQSALSMQSIEIGQELRASSWVETGPTVFQGPVNLTTAQIKENVDFRGARFHRPVDLAGTVVEGRIDVSGATFTAPLTMAASRVEHFLAGEFGGEMTKLESLNLENADIRGQFLCLATCERGFSMHGAHVGRHLFMRAWLKTGDPRSILVPIFKGGVDLRYAKIDGILDMNGARFESSVMMQNIEVGLDLRASSSFGADTNLTAAVIKGSVNIDRAAFGGKLIMPDLRVGRLLTAMKTTFSGPILMPSGEVGGSVQLGRVFANGAIDMPGLRVGYNLLLSGEFRAPIDLSHARIDRTLDIKQAALSRLDLSASRIGGQLVLGLPARKGGLPSQTATWGGSGELDLRDAKAGSLQDWAEPAKWGWRSSWPSEGKVQLDGFTYDRLGGSGVDPSQQMIERRAKWYAHWLSLDQPYSPQPYEHLASILRQAGEAEKANSILFCGRQRARSAAWESPPTRGRFSAGVPPRPEPLVTKLRRTLAWLRFRNRECARLAAWEIKASARWAGMSLLQWTIGYGIGYRYFLALIWALVFTALGFLMLGRGPVGAGGKFVLETWQQKAVYSFDQLLPVIELNHAFGDVSLAPYVEYYFYAHKLFGFLLGSFIVAGIAGLTQRSKS